MQAAKDSFYMALCGRLQAVNPQRTVVMAGEVRPGLVVSENEAAICGEPPEAFCVEWGAATPLSVSPLVASTLMSVDVTFRYRTCGTNNGDCDRGRTLTAMDAELMEICTPQQTPKMDYSQATAAGLGTKIFWKAPQLGPLTQTASMLGRAATTTVYFYPESEA